MENTDDKYYQPDISEFHVGFEYEELEWVENATDREDGWEWVKKVVSTWTPLHHIDRTTSEYDETRVKKLSRECIEELGWVYDDKDTFTIIPSSCDLIYTESLYRWIVILDDGGNTIYNGHCRNKSHLRQLMKDL